MFVYTLGCVRQTFGDYPGANFGVFFKATLGPYSRGDLHGCFCKLGLHFLSILITRALLFWGLC